MKKRGKVVRDPRVGPGLLMVEGRQFHFMPDGVWRSDALPRPGLTVEVEFDTNEQVIGIAVVPDSRLEQERWEAAKALAQSEKSLPSPRFRVDLPTITATAVLVFAWWYLTAYSVHVSYLGKLNFSFWDLLGLLARNGTPDLMDQRGNLDAGIYGALAIAAVAGPFLRHLWNRKAAQFGGLLPLLFVVGAGIAIYGVLANATGGGFPRSDGAVQAQHVVNRISLGLGGYVSLLASLYLAVASMWRFMAAGAKGQKEFPPPRQKAA
ncbi:MAG TPA: hypothetical protein VLT90_10290 [Terriglobales bacterium]|nr:hypothetical protein [Terriglobales bacterium]